MNPWLAFNWCWNALMTPWFLLASTWAGVAEAATDGGPDDDH